MKVKELNMTKKDKHILTFWYNQLFDLQTEEGRPVTAGELGRSVGQSRNTAARYLNRLSGENVVERVERQFPNKSVGCVYFVKGLNNDTDID